MNQVKLFFATAVLSGLAVLCAGQASQAATFKEADSDVEAGQTLATALDAGTVGTGPLTEFINGRFDTRASNRRTPAYRDVVDLYKITLAVDSILTARTLKPDDSVPSRLDDPLLFLFNEAGKLLFSDDDSGRGLQARLTSTPLSADSSYFLGITPWAILPVLNSDGILTGWTGSIGDTNESDLYERNITYRIKLSTTPTEAIPTPALLPGMIGLGMGLLRKRKQQGNEVAV